ncbi:MAG TPA: lipid-A-disaccharide synthase, partial [Blastocatellia bacterium]|nr:lipid-A-disaccharide synthase [Blastocatellia bacterium]
SGTATLETAIIGTPLIVVYKASALNWSLFWPLINVPFVGMPNLIAGCEIVPELLQDELTGSNLANHINDLMIDEAWRKRARNNLKEVKNRLGECHASERAAECLFESLGLSGQKAISTH